MLIFMLGRVVSNFIMQALEEKPLTVRLFYIYLVLIWRVKSPSGKFEMWFLKLITKLKLPRIFEWCSEIFAHLLDNLNDARQKQSPV